MNEERLKVLLRNAIHLLHSEMGYDNIHDFYHNIKIELGMTEDEIIEIEGDDMAYDLDN